MSSAGIVDSDGLARRELDLGGRSLREHAARGTLINAGFTVSFALISFVKGLVLAGFLSTTDYGVWGITAIAVSVVLTLRQVGVVDKYVQQDEEDQEEAFQHAFSVEAVVSGITALVVVAVTPLLALLYDDSRIVLPTLVLAANILANPLQMPLWVFYRRMRFWPQRLIQAIDPLVGTVVALGLAIAGAGYWALFGGLAAGAWSTAIVAVAVSPYRLRFRLGGSMLRSYWSFSAPLLLARAGGPIIAQAAIFAVDARLGIAAAGALTLAATVTQFTDSVDYVITGTLYPAICAVKDRTQLLLQSFTKTNRLALMWAVPFGAGLALFAGDLVRFGLGQRWHEAVPLLHAFGIVAALGHICFNWDAYFRARAETRPMAVAAMAAAATFLLVALPLLFTWGLEGIAVGTAAQMLVHVAFRAYYLRRLFSGFVFLTHALRGLLPSLPAVAVVLLMRQVEIGQRSSAMAAVELAAYLAVTAVATWILERGLLREVMGYLRAESAVGERA